MLARALSLALAFCLPLAARGLAQEKVNPMRYVTAYSAVDGVEVVDNFPQAPFHLRIMGGDPRRISTEQGQLWVPVGDYMYQMVITAVNEVMPDAKKQPDDRTLLAAHAAWECKDHNELLHLAQTATPEFQQIGTRTWCHWTYDLSSLAKAQPKDAGNGPGPQTQHLLTTVLGRKIVVLIGTTLVGQKEDEVVAGLTTIAKTFAVLPKPLTQPQIKELCSQKQP